MSSSEIFITKRDGKRERFSIDKIRAAIAKAFLSVGSFATDEMLTQILGRIRVADGTTVEQIQNQVETALMAERYYKVAKAYIIYRQEHTEDREVRDKLQFLMNYCEAKNPATGSKYDANANVENKNIATLIGELPKQNFIRLNRRLLTDRLKEMYGKEVSDRYLELLDRHFIYKNDETSLANYCASITMYPWLLNGTLSVGGNSTRPTNLKSFCGGFVNMVFIVSSMLSGACATPEFLMYMNYFIEQEYGEDYYKRADEVVDLSRHRRTIDKVITDKPIIKVPGCPPIPDVMSAIITYMVTFDRLPDVDRMGRPLMFYGQRIHDKCYRRAHFDAGEFVQSWDDDAARKGYCLYKMGCKGPTTYNACSSTRWNDGVSFPIQSGHGCLGCAENGFWDRGSFYSRVVDIPQMGTHSTADTVGLTALGVVAAAVGVHAVASAVDQRRRHNQQPTETEHQPGNEDKQA